MYGKKKLKLDSGSKKRDLSVLFQKGNWKETWVSHLLRWLQWKTNGEKRVLLMPAGKLSSYIGHVKENGTSGKFKFIFPSSRKRLLRLFSLSKKTLIYRFHSNGNFEVSKVDSIISNLKSNIRERVKVVDPELLISIMDLHTFPYFKGAYAYYHNAVEMIESLKPSLVIISADGYEHYILVGQAAKYL